MKKALLLTLAIIIMINGMSQNFAKLEKYLDTEITGKLTPGIQFIIADNEGILFEYNNGVSDLHKQKKVDSSTQFKMYSSTKMLTMLAIMQLVEQGQVKLDMPVSEYLDINTPKEVTIRRTLSHTAGFSRYPFVKEIHLVGEKEDFNYSSFLLDMLPKHQKLVYKPGSKNIYSNTGYLILSAIVEHVSGMKYQDYIFKNIVDKVNLKEDEYIGFKYNENTATGYQKRRTMLSFLYKLMIDTKKFYNEKTNKWQSFKPLYMEGIGFGGGFSNARSLAKLYNNVLEYNIISENILNQTLEPQYFKKNKKSKQALGWWTGEVNGNKAFHHAGGGGGYSCEVRVYPDKGIVRIMMMNKTQDFSDLKLFSKIDKLWLEE